MNIHHINCGILHKPPQPKAICHCLVLEAENGLALVDTGIGLKEVEDPEGRVGKEMIEMAGFQFHEELTAIRQIEKMGFTKNDVKHIILSHLDNDHAGGLADFPDATIHVASEEYQAFQKGSYRYLPQQIEHDPKFALYDCSENTWFGLEARKVALNFGAKICLIPLFGHTLGHCGVAIQQGSKWLFYVGDAYYLRAELEVDDHPVSELAKIRAEDNEKRLESLGRLRQLMKHHHEEVRVFGYHDSTEFPDWQSY